MEYLLINLLAISVTASIIYRFAERIFGVSIQLKSLLLCASCAIILSLVVPRIIVGFAGLFGTLALLTLIAIICAFFIAYYDDGITEQACAPEFEPEEGNNEKNIQICVGIDVAATNESSMPDKAVGKEIEEHLKRSDNSVVADNSQEIVNEFLDDKMTSVAIHSDNLPSNDDKDFPSTLIIDECIETAVKPDEVVNDVFEEKTFTAVTKDNSPLNDNQAFSSLLTVDDGIKASIKPQGVVNAVLASSKTVSNDKLYIQEIDPLVTMDELMDYAFKQKEQQNMEQALCAFKKALALYPQTDTASFLVIEIGGLLKRRGSYDEAIDVLSEGRRIARQSKESMLEKEFVDIIAYLRIIKNTLIENRLGYIPFDNIPSHLLDHINNEYSDWRKFS